MAKVQTFHLSHLPPELAAHVALFVDIQNAGFLRDQLLAGNEAFEYALIDASMIVSTTHVLSAVFRAVNDFQAQRLKSRNVHSEIVFALSPNNNIADSFRRFGVSENTKSLLAIKISVSPDITQDSVNTHLSEAIKGTPVAFDDDTFQGITDITKVKKAYKLGGAGGPPKSKGDGMQVNGTGHHEGDLDERKELEVAVIGMMALRGAM